MLLLPRAHHRSAHSTAMKCSGAMSAKCDGTDVQPVDLGLTPLMKQVPMCTACRRVAARFGMIDERVGERRQRGVRQVPGRRD